MTTTGGATYSADNNDGAGADSSGADDDDGAVVSDGRSGSGGAAPTEGAGDIKYLSRAARSSAALRGTLVSLSTSFIPVHWIYWNRYRYSALEEGAEGGRGWAAHHAHILLHACWVYSMCLGATSNYKTEIATHFLSILKRGGM